MTSNVIIYQYLYKTPDQSWNPGKGSVDSTVDDAVSNWKTNCIEQQPGFQSYIAEINVDDNTKKRGWVIDTLDNAKSFWKNIFDANNSHWASLDRKSTRLNSSHIPLSRMPSSA